MDCDTILAGLKSMADPHNAAGMVRFGIDGANVLGISIPALRELTSEKTVRRIKR